MPHKILAIDDHPETLSIVVATLQGHGYHVISSTSPVEGVALAKREKPDLALVDMMMPEMDGTEVCRRIRANPDTKEIPIIMFTAMGEVEYKMSGFDAGADDYLVKPTEPAELIARVEALLINKKPTERKEKRPEDLESTIVVPPGSAELSSTPSKDALIAILSARGGSGATTVAINLATTFAQMNYPTTLVDMDTFQGHIGFYLNQKTPRCLNVLARLSDGELRQKLPEQLITRNQNLKVLLAHPNLDEKQPIPNGLQTAVLLDSLTATNQCVVVDVGRVLNEGTRTVLERADHVIVCLQPDRVALSAAKRILDQIKNILFSDTALSALMFDWIGGSNLPKHAVEGFLGHPVLGMVQVNRKELAQAVNKGMPLVEAYPEAKTTALFLKLAQLLVQA